MIFDPAPVTPSFRFPFRYIRLVVRCQLLTQIRSRCATFYLFFFVIYASVMLDASLTRCYVFDLFCELFSSKFKHHLVVRKSKLSNYASFDLSRTSKTWLHCGGHSQLEIGDTSRLFHITKIMVAGEGVS